MAEPDLNFLLARLDRIQRELGMMRLTNEQREASFQAMTVTLSRQMIELAEVVDRGLDRITARMDERLDSVEQQLGAIRDQLAAIVVQRETDA